MNKLHAALCADLALQRTTQRRLVAAILEAAHTDGNRLTPPIVQAVDDLDLPEDQRAAVNALVLQSKIHHPEWWGGFERMRREIQERAETFLERV